MRLDPRTGELRTDAGILIGPDTPPRFEADGMLIIVEQAGARVRINWYGPPWPSSWDDWTPEIEETMHAKMLAWLETQGVALVNGEATFAWGKVASYWDFKNGTWDTSVLYG